jgi:hypothetical protein
MEMARKWLVSTSTALVALVVGCDSADERLVALSRESLDRQARQTEQIAAQSQEVTRASHELVSRVGQTQQEFLALAHDHEAQRLVIDQQRGALDQERKQIAALRQRDATLAVALEQAALIVAATLPLWLCGYLLWCLGLEPNGDGQLSDVLLSELTGGAPRLSSEPTAVPRLPAAAPQPESPATDS